MTSQEIMENLLNGKNIDDIEFQPNTTTGATKGEEFHFGPNAAPFTSSKLLDQSETLSTKAVFGDESTISYMEDSNINRFDSTFAETDISAIPEFHPKNQDPMSTSFYQDREDDSNPFDLNKVQVLPDNLDEFLNKSDASFNDTISDLPSHNPLDGIPKEDTTETIQVTDLDKPILNEETVKTGDLLGNFEAKSPIEECLVVERVVSPVHSQQDVNAPFEDSAKAETLLQTEEVCSKSPVSELEVCEKRESQSPIVPSEPVAETQSKQFVFEQEQVVELNEDVCLRPDSKSPAPELDEGVYVRSSIEQSPTPIVEQNESICLRSETQTPLSESHEVEPAEEFCLRPESKSSLESQPVDDVCLRPESAHSVPETQSPLPQSHSTENICLRPESDIVEPQSPVADVCLPESSAAEALSPAPSDEICLPTIKSPEPEAPTPEPQGDICKESVITPEPNTVDIRSEPLPVTPELHTEHLAKEEISSEGVTSPIEDITTSVKDEIASPIISPVPKETAELPSENLNEKEVDSGVDSNESVPQTTNNFNVQELSNAILSDAGPAESVPEPNFISTPKSVVSEAIDTESVVTADINSMLEKCNLPDVTSPLSTSEQPSESALHSV